MGMCMTCFTTDPSALRVAIERINEKWPQNELSESRVNLPVSGAGAIAAFVAVADSDSARPREQYVSTPRGRTACSGWDPNSGENNGRR